jgi:hypothetical protein
MARIEKLANLISQGRIEEAHSVADKSLGEIRGEMRRLEQEEKLVEAMRDYLSGDSNGGSQPPTSPGKGPQGDNALYDTASRRGRSSLFRQTARKVRRPDGVVTVKEVVEEIERIGYTFPEGYDNLPVRVGNVLANMYADGVRKIIPGVYRFTDE